MNLKEAFDKQLLKAYIQTADEFRANFPKAWEDYIQIDILVAVEESRKQEREDEL